MKKPNNRIASILAIVLVITMPIIVSETPAESELSSQPTKVALKFIIPSKK